MKMLASSVAIAIMLAMALSSYITAMICYTYPFRPRHRYRRRPHVRHLGPQGHPMPLGQRDLEEGNVVLWEANSDINDTSGGNSDTSRRHLIERHIGTNEIFGSTTNTVLPRVQLGHETGFQPVTSDSESDSEGYNVDRIRQVANSDPEGRRTRNTGPAQAIMDSSESSDMDYGFLIDTMQEPYHERYGRLLEGPSAPMVPATWLSSHFSSDEDEYVATNMYTDSLTSPMLSDTELQHSIAVMRHNSGVRESGLLRAFQRSPQLFSAHVPDRDEAPPSPLLEPPEGMELMPLHRRPSSPAEFGSQGVDGRPEYSSLNSAVATPVTAPIQPLATDSVTDELGEDDAASAS